MEKNRGRLVREADRATRKAHDRYARAIAEAEEARGDVIDCRSAALWASFYPGELATQAPGDTGAVCLNLRRPVEAALQVATRLAAAGVFRVLRADADILAEAQTRDQALDLGVADPHEDAAIWTRARKDRRRFGRNGRRRVRGTSVSGA